MHNGENQNNNSTELSPWDEMFQINPKPMEDSKSESSSVNQDIPMEENTVDSTETHVEEQNIATDTRESSLPPKEVEPFVQSIDTNSVMSELADGDFSEQLLQSKAIDSDSNNVEQSEEDNKEMPELILQPFTLEEESSAIEEESNDAVESKDNSQEETFQDFIPSEEEISEVNDFNTSLTLDENSQSEEAVQPISALQEDSISAQTISTTIENNPFQTEVQDDLVNNIGKDEPTSSSIKAAEPVTMNIVEDNIASASEIDSVVKGDMDFEKKVSSLKKVIIIIAVILFIVVSYLSFQNIFKSKNQKNNNNNLAKTNEFVLEKEDKEKDYVYEADYSKAIDFDKNTGACPISKTTLKVPYINLNSKDAKEVNSEIKFLYEQAVGKYRANIRLEENSCVDVQTAYKAYENGNIISVIVAYATVNNNKVTNPEFYVYNISTETGELIEGYEQIKALSKQSDMVYDDFNNLVKKVMMQEYSREEDSSYTVDEIKNKVSKTTTLKSSTWKEYLANLTVDNLYEQARENNVKAYLGEDGNLGLILTNYYPTGTGSFDKMYTLK